MPRGKRSSLDSFFLLHLKKSLYIIIAWALFIIAHNLAARIFNFDEMFFSILAVYIIPLYLLISVVYTLFKHSKLAKMHNNL